MTDDLRYKISDELLHAICSLQDAYAYVQYAEQLACGRCNGGRGGDLRFRISDLSPTDQQRRYTCGCYPVKYHMRIWER